MDHRSLVMCAAWLWASALFPPHCCHAARLKLQPAGGDALDRAGSPALPSAQGLAVHEVSDMDLDMDVDQDGASAAVREMDGMDSDEDALTSGSGDDSATPELVPGGVLCVASLQAKYHARLRKQYITFPGWGPLGAPKSDAEGVCDVFEKKGLPSQVIVGYAQAQEGPEVKDYNASEPILTRQRVLGALRGMFRSARLKVDPFFMFFYSGHGNGGYFPDGLPSEVLQHQANRTPYMATFTPSDHRGSLVVQAADADPPTIAIADHLTFADLLEAWREEKASLTNGAKFVVMADSCYSGKLAEQLRAVCAQNCTGLNMAVQSAGDECQAVLERPSRHGGPKRYLGELTAWWVAKNGPHGRNVRWSSMPQHPQYPQYFSTWRQSPPKSGPVRDLVHAFPGGIFFHQRWRPEGAQKKRDREEMEAESNSSGMESDESMMSESDDEIPMHDQVV